MFSNRDFNENFTENTLSHRQSLSHVFLFVLPPIIFFPPKLSLYFSLIPHPSKLYCSTYVCAWVCEICEFLWCIDGAAIQKIKANRVVTCIVMVVRMLFFGEGGWWGFCVFVGLWWWRIWISSGNFVFSLYVEINLGVCISHVLRERKKWNPLFLVPKIYICIREEWNIWSWMCMVGPLLWWRLVKKIWGMGYGGRWGMVGVRGGEVGVRVVRMRCKN